MVFCGSALSNEEKVSMNVVFFSVKSSVIFIINSSSDRLMGVGRMGVLRMFTALC